MFLLRVLILEPFTCFWVRFLCCAHGPLPPRYGLPGTSASSVHLHKQKRCFGSFFIFNDTLGLIMFKPFPTLVTETHITTFAQRREEKWSPRFAARFPAWEVRLKLVHLGINGWGQVLLPWCVEKLMAVILTLVLGLLKPWDAWDPSGVLPTSKPTTGKSSLLELCLVETSYTADLKSAVNSATWDEMISKKRFWKC